jgi:molecular chaperone DnaK (HSP70)
MDQNGRVKLRKQLHDTLLDDENSIHAILDRMESICNEAIADAIEDSVSVIESLTAKIVEQEKQIEQSRGAMEWLEKNGFIDNNANGFRFQVFVMSDKITLHEGVEEVMEHDRQQRTDVLGPEQGCY